MCGLPPLGQQVHGGDSIRIAGSEPFLENMNMR
jgi:hypothetical protein